MNETRTAPVSQGLARSMTISNTEVGLGTVVEHQHQSATDATDNVGEEALVETLRHALFRSNLLEAIHGALVEVLLHRLLRLHLQAAAYGVEGIGRPGTDGNGSLGRREGGDRSQESLVLLVRVQAGDGVEGAQLKTAVADDAYHRHAEACVECHEAARASGRAVHAIPQAGEGLLAGSHIRR